MEERHVGARIKTLLKFQPKGLTISQIASRLKLNRNSTAKYLQVLQASGQVESRTIGTARVFCLTHRIPSFTLFSLTSDLVCTIDQGHRILDWNEPFFQFFGLSDHGVLGWDLDELCHTLPGVPSLSELFLDCISDRETVKEVTLHSPSGISHFKVRGIPTVFDDGSLGTTILMEDITRERNYVQNLEFLARTSAELANIGEEENLFQFIVDRIAELVPGSIVTVNSIDMETRISTCEAMGGERDLHEQVFRELGVKIIGSSLKIDLAPEALPILQANTLMEGPGRLYVETYRMFPEDLCDRIDEHFSLGRDFTMGCVCRGGLYGNVTVRLKRGGELRNRETIEAFIRQAGVALQRRHMREKVRMLEERIASATVLPRESPGPYGSS